MSNIRDKCLYANHVSPLDGNPCKVCFGFRAKSVEEHNRWVDEYYGHGIEEKEEKDETDE